MDTKYLIYTILFTNVFNLAIGEGENAKIDVISNVLTLGKDALQIDCKPKGSKYIQVNAIKLRKNNKDILSVAKINDFSNISWSDKTQQARGTAIGDMSTKETAKLRFTVTASKIRCDDKGTYTCVIIGLNEDFSLVGNNEVSVNVSVIAEPDKIYPMSVSPPMSAGGGFLVGTNVTLTCNGTIGSYRHPLEIKWCVQRLGKFYPSEVSSANFSQSTVTPTGTGSCQKQRTSNLVHTVTKEDTNTKFICQITKPGDNGHCGHGTLSRTISIKKYEYQTVTVTLYPTSGPSGKASGITLDRRYIALLAVMVFSTVIRSL